MEMRFSVRDPGMLQTLSPGTTIRFDIIKSGHALVADHISATAAGNFESEPMEAGSLTALKGALAPPSSGQIIQPQQIVPDFRLIDQADNAVSLAQFRGKVVLLTFGYSRCPNPAYCYRLSTNLARVRHRFSAHAGRDLILVTIAIDPEHDNGATLKAYAAVWHADPRSWHFLTGELDDVKQVASMFGMNFWREEGLLTHSLHTAVIGRDGRLVANLEGNQFTAQQLGDLVGTAMDQPR
jgi:protein SCO1/2